MALLDLLDFILALGILGSGLIALVAFFSLDYYCRGYIFSRKASRARQGSRLLLRRPLEALEDYMEHRQRVGSCIVSAAFFVSSRFPLEDNELTWALYKIASENPMLRMRIDAIVDNAFIGGGGIENEEDDGVEGDPENVKRVFNEAENLLYFVEKKAFRPNVESLNTSNWQSVMEEECVKPFNSTIGPLWRVKKLQEVVKEDYRVCVLVCSFHHAIIDGKSVMAFGDRLMDLLSETSLHGSEIRRVLPRSYAEHLGENLLGLSWPRKIALYLAHRTLFGFNVFPKRSPSSFVTWLKNHQPLNPKRAALTHFSIGPEDLETLLGLCHLHGCKLHGVLQAVVNLAQVRTLTGLLAPGAKKPSQVQISCMYAESVREFVDPPLEWTEIGSYALGRIMTRKLKFDRDAVERSFWTMAKSISDQVHENLRQRPVEPFFKAGELVYRIFPLLWRKSASQPTPENFNRQKISVDYVMGNYGSFLNDRQGQDRRPFDITAAYSATNVKMIEACFGHYILSLRGELFWTISYSEAVITYGEGIAYSEEVKETLWSLIQGEME